MRIADLSWQEYEQRIRSHVVVLPVGAIEAHGPHLPLSTDTVVATFLADTLEDELDVLMLPPIPYGHKTSPGPAGGTFPGVTNLRSSTLIDLMLDVLTASYGHGARKFLILNAHIANVPIVSESLDIFFARAPEARIMAVSWWDVISEQTRNAIARETGVDREDDRHAAMVETSLMLHVAPDLVKRERIADDSSTRQVRYLVLPMPESLRTRSGIVYRARKASAEIGRRVMAEIRTNLVEAVRLELGVDHHSPTLVTRPG